MKYTLHFYVDNVWHTDTTCDSLQEAIANADEWFHHTGQCQRITDELGREVYRTAGIESWVGRKVKFANPENEAEQSYIMTVVEDNDNRVLVQTPIEGFSEMLGIPTATYLKTDLKPAE